MPRFSRFEKIVGEQSLTFLSKKTVLVLGCGGVGGYVIEALARSNIGTLILVDYDKVDETNINRQIIALHSNIGKKKTECFKERLLDINPNINVMIYDLFYGKDNKDVIFNGKIDYVIDCCDSLESKKILIEECFKRDIPIISSMGTGNKLHPELFKITKLSKTEYDPLAKKMRYLFRDNKEILNEVMVIYSSEKPSDFKGKIGSISFVPSVAGLMLTSFVINEFLEN